jgi:hypothetical protein
MHCCQFYIVQCINVMLQADQTVLTSFSRCTTHTAQCRSESHTAVQHEASKALSNAVALSQLVTAPPTTLNTSSNSNTTVTAQSSAVKPLITVSDDGHVTLQADVATRVHSLLRCKHFCLISVPTSTLLLATATAAGAATAGAGATVSLDVAATAAAYGHTHSKRLQLPMTVLHSAVYGIQHRFTFDSSGDALYNCLCIPVHTVHSQTA